MSVKEKIHQVNDVLVIELSGRLTVGDGSVMLRDRIRKELAGGRKRILINLGDVSYIDSSGLGELISAFTSTTKSGGELKLLNLTKKIRDLMEIVRLYTIFDIYDNEGLALASFSARQES